MGSKSIEDPDKTMIAYETCSGSDESDVNTTENDEVILTCRETLRGAVVPTEEGEKKKKRGRPPKNSKKNIEEGHLRDKLQKPDKILPPDFLRITDANSNVSNNSRSVSAPDPNMQSTLEMLILELGHMRSAISDFTNKITNAPEKISTLEKENATLRFENANKDKKIKDLESKLDEAEQAARSSTLILSGSSVNVSTDDLHGSASKLLADTLKIDIAKASQYSYRKMKESANIMITVAKYEDRANIFTAARTIKPSNFYVSEALTQRRQRLLYE